MSFYLSWLPSSPNSLYYRRWLEGIRTGKLNYLLGIPTFNIQNLPWIGATYIATEFWGIVSGTFSIRKLNVRASDYNFFLCVRTPQRNLTGLDVTRYKLWEPGGPTEQVRLETFPVYNEQRLGPEFVIEVWTVPYSETVSMVEVSFLISSLIIDPVTCCCDTSPVIQLVEHCDIWATQNENQAYTLPIRFDTCFNAIQPPDTYLRVDEFGNIRQNELGDLRTYV